MKRIVLLAAGGAALVILLLAAFLALFDVNKYRPQIEAQVSQTLNRKVTIAQLSLRLIPLSIRINGLKIADAPEFSSTPFATAEEVYANANLFALLTGKPQVDELTLSRPHLQLVRNKAGKWNFSTLGTRSTSSNSNSTLSLGRVVLTDGIVTIASQADPGQASDYDHINITLTGFSPAKPFQVTVSLHLPGKGAEALSLRATVGPLNPSDPALTPVDAHLEAQQVSIADLAELSTTHATAAYKGEITGTADLRMDKGNLTSEGSLAINHLQAGTVSIPFLMHITYKVNGNVPASAFVLDNVDLQLERQHFGLTGKIDAKADKTLLDLDVKIPTSPIAELALLAGAFGPNVGLDANGSLYADVQVKGTADAPLLSGMATLSDASFKSPALSKPVEVRRANVKFDKDSFNVDELNLKVASTTLKGVVGIKNFKHPQLNFKLQADTINVAELESLTTSSTSAAPAKAAPRPKAGPLDDITGTGSFEAGSILAGGLELDKIQTSVNLDRGIIKLSPVSASLFGGVAAGTINADLRPKNPSFNVQLSLNGLDCNNLLTAVSAAKDTLYGTLAAKTNLQFTVAPDGDLMRTLNGSLGFNVTNGKIRNIDVLNELGKIAKFTGATPPQGNETPIKKLSGDLQLTNGVAATQNLVGEIAQGSVASKGTVNLVNQALDLKAVATLATGPSKSFGGTMVGGLMSTVIANKNGELVIPANVKGTTAKPVFTPDLEAMAKLKLSNILPTAANPAALGDAAEKAAGALGGLLKGFGKKQPKQ